MGEAGSDSGLAGAPDLMAKALQRAEQGIDPTAPGRLVIRSISAKQRPRRPA